MEGVSPSGAPQKPFICGYVGCKKSYLAKQHLVRHVKVYHYNIVKKNTITCNKCQETFTCKQNLSKHIARKHSNTLPFKCHYCPDSFKRKTLLAYHLYQHTGTKLLSCDFCDKTFANQTERGRHQSKHKIFRCECDEEFTNWGEILEHKKKQHVSPEYECDLCQKVFKSRAYIVRHMKIHAVDDERIIFVCPKCPKFYTFKSNLIQHIKSAHENKTFNCSYPGCGAKLSTQSKLNFHYQRHINPQPKKEKIFKPRKKRKDAGIKKKKLAEDLGGTIIRKKRKRKETCDITEKNVSIPLPLPIIVQSIKEEIEVDLSCSNTENGNQTIVKTERYSDNEEFLGKETNIKTERMTIDDGIDENEES